MWQNGSLPPVARLHANSSKPGFIYIYTYKLLYQSIIENDQKKVKWLTIDNSIIQQNDTKSITNAKWKNNGYILCKIGMTTKKNVEMRLQEWKAQCTHDIINLTPENVSMLINHKKSLSSLFKKLSIKKTTEKKLTVPSLYTYQDGGFYYNGSDRKMSLLEIENSLHQLFWRKYGKGLVYCEGCNHHRHLEWFHIPINDLPSILSTIDSFVLSQKK